MCRWLLTLSDDQLIKTAFTDEATFSLGIELICFLKIRLLDFFNLNSNYIYVKLYVSDGSLNVLNCTRYIESRRRGGAGRNGLADKLLHQTDKFPSKLMVFLGTCAGRVFGVKFIQGSSNSRKYQQHVKEVCIPELREINGGSLEGLTWQQELTHILLPL